MSPTRRTSSFTSSHFDSDEFVSRDKAKLKSYYKKLLKNRIFLGRYIERRLIDERIGYRDIVVLSAAETDLKRDLYEAAHKLRIACLAVRWIGVTDAELLGYNSAICLCTEINNQPLGPFWFQIKSLKFREEEVIVILRCLKHISDAFLELEPILTKRLDKNNEKGTAALHEAYNDVVRNLKNSLTISNIKEFITILLALVIAIFTGSTAFVNLLGNFILTLITELSLLLKNSTPIFLGVLDFLSKIGRGFYILAAMFFKPNPSPSNKQTIRYYDQQRYDGKYKDNQFD